MEDKNIVGDNMAQPDLNETLAEIDFFAVTGSESGVETSDKVECSPLDEETVANGSWNGWPSEL